MANQGGREGFFAGVQNITVTLMAMLQARLALLGNEAEEEKLRIMRMLLLAQTAMFSACVATLLAAALLTLWLWELRLGVLALLAGLALACAYLAYRSLMRMLTRPEPAFAATLGELQEDLRRLKEATGHATTPD